MLSIFTHLQYVNKWMHILLTFPGTLFCSLPKQTPLIAYFHILVKISLYEILRPALLAVFVFHERYMYRDFYRTLSSIYNAEGVIFFHFKINKNT